MSQVTFRGVRGKQSVEVTGGWDRPLQHYHLTVYGEDGDPLWSTLDAMPTGGSRDLEPLARALRELGIVAPEGFWTRVEAREGNVCTTLIDGEWVRQEFR